MARFTLRQLEYLITCVETGSVAGAAARLNVSAPTISVAITKLEDQLGMQLLLRHHAHGVTPSNAAATLLPMARNLLAQADDLEREAHQSGQTMTGRLTIGALSTLAPKVLPPVISAMGEAHPRVEIAIREGAQAQVVADLHAGTVDLALLYDIDLPETLACRKLGAPVPYVALPEGHPLTASDEVSLRQLATEPMILLDMPPSRSYFLGFFRGLGVEPRIAHTSPSIELVRGLVGQGLGYALLVTRPESDLSYDGRRVVTRPLADGPAPRAIVIATLASLRETRAMEVFCDLAARTVNDRD